MNVKKPQTFVEKLKELQRQYISLEYRLNKLIEEYSEEPQESLHDLVNTKRAAEILHCSTRNVCRIAAREQIVPIRHNGRVLYEKSKIEEIASLRW